jgi:hypothetical protein
MLFEAIRVFRNDDRSNIIGIQMISFLVVSVSSSLEDFVSLCLRVFVMRMKGLNRICLNVFLLISIALSGMTRACDA